ncbi:eukaryotic translation initiation factor 4B isoform X2 [Anticarsia gemmatalis]|uniref:eukaryotic translation initiation factor 4B isoform X2 n=1 Tax=Anticarsia gemmatalis TaxID=129554 RepID=UPI003F76F1F2
MAATGKKSKKAKWIKASITDIIAEPTTIATTNNWADSVDEEPETYGYASRSRAVVTLPSASRAARGGLAVDDESIPRRPPFTAHISNLPYDVDESAITELFAGLKITNLRLPRDGDRLKGFGCVDFEEREGLINAMNMSDLTIGGRRIRIELSTQDNDRRMGRGNRSDRDREYDPERTMGDWRSGPRAMPDSSSGRPRNPDRERDRDRDRDRERDSSADNRPGGWRDGDRPAPPEPARTPYGGRDSFGRDRGFGGENRERGGFGRDTERSGYGGRDGFRTAEREGGGGGFGSRDSRGFGGRGFGDRDRDPPPREEAKARERPKLNLLPRTVPRDVEAPQRAADGAPLDDKLPDKPAPKPVSAEKVFGAAKPVDTAAKEREIEERLRKQEEEARRGGEEKERWGRRNDHSGDRRAPPPKRDERGRDSRSYNRDRRDYSKDDKDRRDYRDDRERRDRDERDSRPGRDRDYKDERDRRDQRDDRDIRREHSGDRRDRRDYSGDRRPRRDYSGDKRREPSGERRERRDYSGSRRGSRDERDYRDGSRERRAPERDASPPPARDGPDAPRDVSNGRARPSRSRDRHDEYDDKPLPKMKEQEKPNFVGSNKFSCLGDADDGASD